MIITKLIDPYNQHKIWILKKYARSELYVNQQIKGHKFYTRFQRTTKKFMKTVMEAK